ncbi:sugar ABC transporter permease [Iocasia frigidifontis]|uniref:Xylose transport system permease protein XylH n=1 Tax=Iocasia fonsfrigidae TaxID=2682810 RepID=A0A8A7KN10_9FIRM|nr:multiple monosaccharide ABC transporter permease [Iocasia fonsfrigidae]QTL99232.1 sugar ABC transporter permease [Iocasia fonsfrigidae]
MNWTTIRNNLKQYMLLFVLLGIIVLFQVLTNGILLKPMNVSNLIFQNAYVVILATGMLLCILTGGNIDLSVGSVCALIGACAGTFIISWGWNPHLSILLSLLIGIGIGVWQGFWIAYVRIPAFIVTLAGMLIFRGLTLIVLNGLTLAPFPSEYRAYSAGFIPDLFENMHLFGVRNSTSLVIGIILAIAFSIYQIYSYNSRKNKGYSVESLLNMGFRLTIIAVAIIWVFYILANYRGVPMVFIILGIILIVYSYFTSSTVPGRHIYALGGNEKAARLSGVKTRKLLFLVYVNMAFLASIAGIVFSTRLNSASPQAGQLFELDAIGACFIGGASATGGIGTISGALIGAMTMGILNNGMSIMGVSSNVQQVVKGLVLLAAVAFDVISKQNIRFNFLSKLRRKGNKHHNIDEQKSSTS